jgi:hypothetical protein
MAMPIRRLFALIGVLMLVALLVIGGPASAAKKKKRKKHPRTWGTNATLVYVGGAFFNGDVSSKLSACVQGRLVTLTYFDPTGAPPTPIGVERTNSKGRATFDVSPFAYPGTYQLTVAPDKHKIKGRIHTCRATESPKLPV